MFQCWPLRGSDQVGGLQSVVQSRCFSVGSDWIAELGSNLLTVPVSALTAGRFKVFCV